MSIIDILKGEYMINEQTHSAEETFSNKETEQEINSNVNAEQTSPEESGSASGSEKPEQVDFAQMYDMLTERDSIIKTLKSEVAELKKANTQLLLKVNSSGNSGDSLKTPYESFIDAMVQR